MDGLLLCVEPSAEPFREFGDSAFADRTTRLSWLDLNRPRRAVRREIREFCPTASGVYGMIDCDLQLIYVGTSRSLRHRLLTYFYQGTSGAKEKRISSHARTVVWEPAGHELTAQLRELELIQRWRPRFNVRGQPGRSRPGYVCLTREETPQFVVRRQPPRGCHQTWGPIATGRRMRCAVQTLNRVFHLPDCARHVPKRFPEQRELFPLDRSPSCLRGMLSGCLAPCAGRCSRAEYTDRVRAASDFLEGRGAAEFMDRRQAEMLEAADRQEFERAATLRDQWDDLTYLNDQMQRRRDAAAGQSCVYTVHFPTRETIWYLIVRGRIVRAITAPQDPNSAKRSLHTLEQVFAGGKAAIEGQSEDDHQRQLAAAWFRRHPNELNRTIPPNDAIEVCQRMMRNKPTAA